MLVLKKDEVEQKVQDITRRVGEDLAQYKGASSASGLKAFPEIQNDFILDAPRSYNIGERFTTQELYEKVRTAFKAQNIDKIPFEFALVTLKNDVMVPERQSKNFAQWYQ